MRESLLDRSPARQGTLSSLLDHLWGLYEAALKETYDKVAARGDEIRSWDQVRQAVRAPTFLRFAREYLDRNRPAETFALDRNLGVKLTDGAVVSLCPRAVVEGDMQPANAVAIGSGDFPAP